MNNELKDQIIENKFDSIVRLEMRFDDKEYQKLCDLLKQLADELSESESIDKDLALTLYSLPLVVRNMYLSFANEHEVQTEMAVKLEDAWVELDGLVLDVFTSS